ncbi:MAG: 30S ribosomal protein S5 [Candidatus Omnitrophica bacterium]|nr:30S ribosomal protein S5 [Candidatus Omnitrophota bacterium]
MGKDFAKKDEIKAPVKGRKDQRSGTGAADDSTEVVEEGSDASKPAGPRKSGFRPRKPVESESGLIEKVVAINRVAKTTKGGTRLAFSALVVVGDGKGKVGFSLGKAGEVANAIKKALNGAKRSMVKIHMRGTTITHEVLGECGSAKVLLKPASEGTGVIAAGPVRAICDGAGITNILTKCHRSNNPINVVKAAFEGLSRLKSMDEINVITES